MTKLLSISIQTQVTKIIRDPKHRVTSESLGPKIKPRREMNQVRITSLMTDQLSHSNFLPNLN